MRILQVSASDQGGGAERVALALHRAYRGMGHESVLLVGWKKSREPGVETLEEMKGGMYPVRRFLGRAPRLLGLELLFDPRLRRWLRKHPGWDVVHFHNIQAGYLPFRFLQELPVTMPVVWTLHDCWAFTGHCAHPMDCPGWLSDCTPCPDIRRYPRIRRDAAGWNLEHKRRVFRHPRLTLVSPSHWLLRMLERSILTGLPRRVIPNGVSSRDFFPGDRQKTRRALSLPLEPVIALFAATAGLDNPWKGGDTVREFMRRYGDRCLTVILGGEPEPGWAGRALFLPAAPDLGPWYRAADFFLYPTRADNCPLVLMEAMACGLPAVAAGAGGVPEVVEDRKTGFLVGRADREAFLSKAGELLAAEGMRKSMSEASVERYRRLFTLEAMVEGYLALYQEAPGGPPLGMDRGSSGYDAKRSWGAPEGSVLRGRMAPRPADVNAFSARTRAVPGSKTSKRDPSNHPKRGRAQAGESRKCNWHGKSGGCAFPSAGSRPCPVSV